MLMYEPFTMVMVLIMVIATNMKIRLVEHKIIRVLEIIKIMRDIIIIIIIKIMRNTIIIITITRMNL